MEEGRQKTPDRSPVLLSGVPFYHAYLFCPAGPAFRPGPHYFFFCSIFLLVWVVLT
jgi:hypothetical protein